ncbi:hypothetical protein HOLleu_22317 [Holothuria leucospilota]|uniref:Uncharacterized protein n=1 Tax=Holothuria leucospilota TaxID=206669 RepID=A0A9Q1H7F1_HOLLE|nr:hypothetical protein HOLleu_22317 [Holothuria leucospilota]
MEKVKPTLSPKWIILFMAIYCESSEAMATTEQATTEPTPVSIPLPEFPQQYWVYIEANLNQNETIYVEENYDGPGNRGSAYIHTHDHMLWITYDLLNSQRITTIFQDGMEPVCNVTNFTDDSFTIFQFHLANGTYQIGSTADLFRFGKQYNETYIGEDVVRGIPVNHWMTSLSHEDGSSVDLHYYFSVEAFHAVDDGWQVPIRATLNGTSRLSGRYISHVYEFFDMHVGLPSFGGRAFEPPLGLACVGRLSRKELPKFPDIFSFRGESFGQRENLSSFSIFYSYPAKTTALEFITSNGTFLKYVHDFSYGLTFKIFENSGACAVSPIQTFSPDAVVAADGIHVSLQNPTDTFINKSLTWVYEGPSIVRGLAVESWISEPYNTLGRTNATTEFFFAFVNQSAFPGFPKDVTHFPVRRIDRYKTVDPKTSDIIANKTVTMDMFSFNHEVTGPWHFDTSACFEEDNQSPVAFDLEGKGNFKNYVQNNSHNFHHGVYESLLNITNLTSSRIAHVMFEEGKDEVMTIFFTILGVPKVQGNAVNSTQNYSRPLNLVLTDLKVKVDLGQVSIVVKVKDKMVTIPVKQGTFRSEFGPRTEKVVKNTGVRVGAVVGIAFLTLAIGIVIGIVAIVTAQKKMNFAVPYQTQK